MDDMNITSAQYMKGEESSDPNFAIKATIDGTEVFAPLDLANRHYFEIMRQVAAGTLTILDAE